MANGIELAKAYVQIVPSADGIESSLEKAMGSASEKAGKTGGSKIASGIGSAMGKVAKVTAAGLALAGAGVTSLTKSAMESFAQYEQLSGGVEKLYGNAAGQIEEFAQQAYATAGMSANQYMETATSFSASLIGSLGGDVQEAARLTDVAMRAMSDNVNVFGSDAVSVQNAYQGFAKQNYTMLDNLKLGYGGTKSEMERLIADANAYRASVGETADLSIESFADVVKAIQSIQEAQNIAGTTGKEAMTTIEGSATATKAAWANVLTAIGTGKGLDTAIDNLMSAVFGGENGGGLLNNILPRVQTILTTIGEYLPTAAPEFIRGFVNLVVEIIPSLMESVVSLFQGREIAEALIQALRSIISTLVTMLPVILPKLIDGIVMLFVMLCENFQSIIDPIIKALPDIINSITDALIRNLPLILAGIIMLIAGIVAEIPSLLVGIWETITHFFSEVWKQWVGPAFEKVGGFFSGIWEKVVNFFSPLIDWIRGVWEKIVQGFHTVIDPWIEIFKRAFLAIKTTVIDPITRWFSEMWAKISGFASQAWEGIKRVFQPVADWFKNIFSKAWQAVKNVFSAGGRIFDGIKDGIVTAFKTVVNAIIRGINKVITVPFNAINGILSRIHNIRILGVSPFTWVGTFAVPQIPELATGGVLERGQMALLEGSGAEAVVPLEKNTGWIRKVALEMQQLAESPDNYIDTADEIVEAIRNLRLYLDGDRLVGGVISKIDTGLGTRSAMAGRGVATA